jgi:ribosome biogenesis GTPase
MPPAMDALHRLGWTPDTAAAWLAHAADGLRPARVAAQHRGGYIILTPDPREPSSAPPVPSDTSDPAPSPAPSDTSHSAPSPAPSGTSYSSPSPAPSDTPDPTPSPAPSGTPYSSPSPAPSDTSDLAPSPAPSDTPDPAASPAPSDTSDPAASPAPSDTPDPAPPAPSDTADRVEDSVGRGSGPADSPDPDPTATDDPDACPAPVPAGPGLLELRADLSGKLRRAAASDPAAGPAVGDWVAIRGGPVGCATIHAVLPRTSQLSRRAAGRTAIEQVVAANVDTVLVVIPLDRPIATRRLERLLIIARSSGAAAAIVLTKADLCPDPGAAAAELAPLCARAGAEIPVHTISSVTGEGLAALDLYTSRPQTTALIGASGVGKSTLLNRWLGHERQAVAGLTSEGKGRHTTTHRELLVLPGGGLVIDTPGMRELGLWRTEDGLQDVFADVAALAEGCRFRDCHHADEPGCAVQAAIAAGTLAPDRAASFLKLQREQAHVERQHDDLARARARQADRRTHRALGRFYRDRGDR